MIITIIFIINPNIRHFGNENLLKNNNCEIIEILDVCDKITKFLKLNKLPHYTTIQKFFVRISDTKLKDLNKLILFMHPIDCELAAMDELDTQVITQTIIMQK